MLDKKRMLTPFVLAIFTLLLVACGGEQSNADDLADQAKQTQKTKEKPDERRQQVKKIFYTIPSPIEMASLIQKTEVPFNKDVLNDYKSSSNYTTVKQQALNLGIYGADLSYTSMFEEDQESLYYLGAVQKLAKALDVDGAIDTRIYERINSNRQNRDSLLAIVSDAYWSLNAYLKESDRESISALVIAGGWFEGLYLASIHMSPENADLKQRVAEQKYSLKDLMGLLKSYPNDKRLESVVADLQSIQDIFDGVKINKAKTETSQDESGTMVIGGASTIDMSDETLAAVKEKVLEIRAKYIQ